MSENIISQRLISAREHLGITKAEAARRLNLSSIGYCRYEYGDRTPSIQTLEVIAQCFGTSVAYLTGETDEFAPDKIVVDKNTNRELFNLLNVIRMNGFSADIDYMNRNIKAKRRTKEQGSRPRFCTYWNGWVLYVNYSPKREDES